MNKAHRMRIDQCIDQMVPRLDMVKLWPKLFEYNIYKTDDCNVPKWEHNLTEPETKRNILTTIKTRGPEAFNNLLISLRATGHKDLADELESPELEYQRPPQPKLKTSNQREDNGNYDQPTELYNPSTATERLQINVRKATEFLDKIADDDEILGRYSMRSKNRGLVLIISLILYTNSDQDNRTAGEYDEEYLSILFTQMGFKVILKKDLTNAELRRVVKQFSQNPELRSVDSCFVIICGHGKRINGDSVVAAVDSVESSTDYVKFGDVVTYFSAENCPFLVHKPKVFIFATCRGNLQQRVVEFRPDVRKKDSNSFKFDDDTKYNHRGKISSVPNFADILIVCSTIPGYVSFRDKITGTWYIQTLCDVFMKYAYKYHIDDLFKMVDKQLQTLRTGTNRCQTSSIKNIGFNRKLYINPGLFEDVSPTNNCTKE